MNRIFGTSKPPPPKPTLTETMANIDTRTASIDQKVAKLEVDLKKLRDQMSRMPEGPAKNGIKQRALTLLKQKKLYEGQRDQLMQQSFNMEQAHLTSQNLASTLQTVEVMRQTNMEMKKQYQKMDINKIEDVRDDMEDMLEQANEIQEVMSRSYGLPDGLDEDSLDAELAALGDDVGVADTSYLDFETGPAVPNNVPRLPESAGRASTARAGVDEFGLPAPAST